MTLQSFGLSAADEAVWRRLLRTPGAAVADLDAEAAASVERLAVQGIVHVEDGRCRPADPGAAFDRLMARRLDEVGEQLREIASAGSVLPGLLTEHQGAAATESVERLDGVDAVNRRIVEISSGAREVLAMHGVEDFKERPELTEHTLRRLGSGVAYRTIVHRSMLAHDQFAARTRRLHEAGDRHRLSDVDLRDVLIYDRAAAFVRIDPADRRAGAFLIRQPGMVATLVDCFEFAWNAAADLVPGPGGPSDTERRVLDLLTRHGKDEAAARAMGVSVRTFRRHVADLTALLGAANRFHLGVLAARRGWL